MDTNAIQKKQRTENRETRNQFQRVTSFRALEQSIVGRKRGDCLKATVETKNRSFLLLLYDVFMVYNGVYARLDEFWESLDEFLKSLDEFSSLDEFLGNTEIRQVENGLFQLLAAKTYIGYVQPNFRV